MEAITMGLPLGIVLGLLPGGMFTLVATTALSRGKREGIKVALLPLGTELPAVFGSALVLIRLPEDAIRWLGVGGGLLILYLAWRVVRDARNHGAQESEGNNGHLLRVALLGVVYPNAWVFWLLLGGPLLLNRWYQSALQGVLFPAAFLVGLVGVRVTLAWTSAQGGRRFLGGAWRQRILTGAGGVLALLGLLLIWQSWEGNFHEMMAAPERVEEELR